MVCECSLFHFFNLNIRITEAESFIQSTHETRYVLSAIFDYLYSTLHGAALMHTISRGEPGWKIAMSANWDSAACIQHLEI